MNIDEADPSAPAAPPASAAVPPSSGLPGRIEYAVDHRLGSAVERAGGHVPAAVKPKLMSVGPTVPPGT